MPPRPSSARRWSPRIAVIVVAALGYIVLALGVGFDRAVEQHADWAGRIPRVFARAALLATAQQALARQDASEAAVAGKRLVEVMPLEPNAASTLGAAQWFQGDMAAAQTSFAVSARMGWRAPVTQQFWMQQALLVGDYRVAALRLDALLRQDPTRLSLNPMMAGFEATPQGQAAMGDRLMKNPDWLAPYAAGDFAPTPQALINRAPVLLQLAARGHHLGCERVKSFVARVAQAGAPALALQVWRAHCPDIGTSLIADGRFQHSEIGQNAMPFDWQFYPAGDVGLLLVDDGQNGRRLQIDMGAQFSRMIVSQQVLWPEGRYLLTWRAPPAGEAQTHLVPGIDCGDGNDQMAPALYDANAKTWHSQLTIPAGCRPIRLSFTAQYGNSGAVFDTAKGLYLSDIMVTSMH